MTNNQFYKTFYTSRATPSTRAARLVLVEGIGINEGIGVKTGEGRGHFLLLNGILI